jgi:hypothetical protein
MKKIVKSNSESKDFLEELEQYILATSETINEKLEDIEK